MLLALSCTQLNISNESRGATSTTSCIVTAETLFRSGLFDALRFVLRGYECPHWLLFALSFSFVRFCECLVLASSFLISTVNCFLGREREALTTLQLLISAHMENKQQIEFVAALCGVCDHVLSCCASCGSNRLHALHNAVSCFNRLLFAFLSPHIPVMSVLNS